jgi:HEAT repeat protein
MFFRRRPPAIKKLRAKSDADGLVAALGYRDIATLQGEQRVDLGVPIRVQATRALGELPGRRALEGLLRALIDPAEQVRAESLLSLRDRPEPEARQALFDTLGSEFDARDELGRSVALIALSSISYLDLLQPLCERFLVMEAPLDAEHKAALEVLTARSAYRNGKVDVGESLASALGADWDLTRRRAEDLLTWLRDDAVEPTIDALDTPAARPGAIRVLGRLGDQRALRPLVQRLADEDGSVRAAAASALGEIRDPRAVEPLIRATRDPEHQVRDAAIAALDGLGAVAVIYGVSLAVQPMLSGAESPAIQAGEEPAEPVRGEVLPPEAFEELASRDFWSRLWGRSGR